jgi:hypothetical protein
MDVALIDEGGDSRSRARGNWGVECEGLIWFEEGRAEARGDRGRDGVMDIPLMEKGVPEDHV